MSQGGSLPLYRRCGSVSIVGCVQLLYPLVDEALEKIDASRLVCIALHLMGMPSKIYIQSRNEECARG